MSQETRENAQVMRKRICDILLNLSKPETIVSDVVNDMHLLILEAEQASFKEACRMVTEKLSERTK